MLLLTLLHTWHGIPFLENIDYSMTLIFNKLLGKYINELRGWATNVSEQRGGATVAETPLPDDENPTLSPIN